MDELFHKLESHLRALLNQHENLKHINQNLVHSQSVLLREKEGLLVKNKLAIAQIENMVIRLKSIESSS